MGLQTKIPACAGGGAKGSGGMTGLPRVKAYAPWYYVPLFAQKPRFICGKRGIATQPQPDFDLPACLPGGEGGIRTHGRLAPTAVFKTAALNHSATSPAAWRLGRSRWLPK